MSDKPNSGNNESALEMGDGPDRGLTYYALAWRPFTDTSRPTAGVECLFLFACLNESGGLSYDIDRGRIDPRDGEIRIQDANLYHHDSALIGWLPIPPPLAINDLLPGQIEIVEIKSVYGQMLKARFVDPAEVAREYAVGCILKVKEHPHSHFDTPMKREVVGARFVGYDAHGIRRHEVVVDFTKQEQQGQDAKHKDQVAASTHKRKAKQFITRHRIEPDTSRLEAYIEEHRALLDAHGLLEYLNQRLAWVLKRIANEAFSAYRNGIEESEMCAAVVVLSERFVGDVLNQAEKRVAEARSIEHHCRLYEQFVAEHGSGDIPAGFIAADGKELGLWVKNIGRLKKTPKQKEMLRRLGLLAGTGMFQTKAVES